jgi:hypothetical protein
MKPRLPELSRRATLVLTIVLTTLSVALLAAAAFAPDENGSAPAPEPREPVREVTPTPVVSKVRTHSPVGRFERARCRVEPHRVESPQSWFHPVRNFHPPHADDLPTRADLDHLALRDGAVIVTYRPGLRRAAREALKRWAAKGIGVLVAPARRSSALEAYTSDRRLACDGVDLDRLTQFTDRHFSKPIALQPHANSSG